MIQPILGRKIRFALVGCGRISKNHFGSLREHAQDAELVGVCDIDPAALARAVQETGAKGYPDIDALLADTNADVIVLTTPSGVHPGHAIKCAHAGFHVLTEKPMATKWEDGLRMVRECDEAGVHLFVVKQNRRNATLQLLKKAVEAKRFGRIYMVTLNVFWQRPQVGYYDQAKWRGTWEMDGGAFMNQASHYVDLLEWLIGPIESLHAYTATLARDIEAEDTGVLGVKWRSGALGQNVYVGNDVAIGDNVKIQNNVSVYDAVTLEDDVFCGSSMVFTNVYNPRSAVTRKNEYRRTLVKKGATLGANCTIVCGTTIGEYAFVGAGAVVNRDVPPFALMVGVPARQVGWMSRFGERLPLPLQGDGEATCPHTGDRYRLVDGVCRIVD